MTLSIIILTHNQWHYTSRVLDSLFPYLLKRPDTDVVIVDNGSADGTAEKFIEWSQIHPETSERIKIISLHENMGVAAGRNRGIRASEGELVLILDNDTIVDGTALDGLRQYISQNHSCGICAPALRSPDGELQCSAKPYPGPFLKLAHIFRPGKELKREKDEMKKAHPWYVIGACQMMRRTTFDAIGPLDEAIFYGPEDADYCARVRKEGLTVDYLPELEIIHDWRRATRKKPFSRLGILHMKALFHFWLRHPKWTGR